MSKAYDSKDIMKYFSVTEHELEQWIKRGRFIIYEGWNLENFKIYDHSLYITEGKRVLAVSEVVEAWDKERENCD
ncbi:hypothetical protein [Priestia abyssalis]|uniref:hypothetical protein n=1 Tax=Priestia abyssalis TaxID=1221450 RepID=UPI000994E7D4|nr:hypothetical protein [Priestia abyssalis]